VGAVGVSKRALLEGAGGMAEREVRTEDYPESAGYDPTPSPVITST